MRLGWKRKKFVRQYPKPADGGGWERRYYCRTCCKEWVYHTRREEAQEVPTDPLEVFDPDIGCLVPRACGPIPDGKSRL